MIRKFKQIALFPLDAGGKWNHSTSVMTDFFFCDTNGTAPGLLCLRRFDSLKNNKYILGNFS
jgi:hypothetical protein